MPLFGRQPVALPLFHWRGASRILPPPPKAAGPATAPTRQIDCPHCGEPLRVPARALNTRCTACHKHLLAEDVIIRGDSVRTSVITGGSILVEPSARFAGILQAAEVVVAGRVRGTVIGTRRIQVTETGKIAGTVATRSLIVHHHALIDGEVNILNADGSISTTPTAPHAPSPA